MAAKKLSILFQDMDFIAVDKPAGMLAIPDRYRPEIENLHDLLAGSYGKVHPVHRLDRETSGIMVFALNPDANRELSRQFETHTVQKTYLALVQGSLDAGEGLIDAPIGDDHRLPGRMRIDQKHGKPAQTEYQVVEVIPPFSLVEMRPRTGRQHQIRVHLRHIGHPLAVDPVYGTTAEIRLSAIKKGFKNPRADAEKPLIDRLTLHAWKLRFFHFRKKEEVELVSPLPKDFEVLLKQLRKWGRA